MDILAKVSGLFERRFLMNALLPSAVFWASLAALAIFTMVDFESARTAWSAQSLFARWLAAAVAAIWLLATAGVLSASSMSILRLFEGYWFPPLSWLSEERGKAWHRQRLETLKNRREYTTIYYDYPPPTQAKEVMPTRLGNILKSGEVYATQRYGLDPVIIWPRLFTLLPGEAVSAIGEARSALEFNLAVSVMAGLFSIIAGVWLLWTGSPWWLFLTCFWGGLGVAGMEYITALPIARVYSEQVKSTFDSHRNELLLKMRIPLPSDPEEERATWRELTLFLLRNVREHPDAWKYVTNPEGPAN